MVSKNVGSQKEILNNFSEKSNKLLHELFSRSLEKKQALEFAYCLLRVGGVQDADWDEFIESQNTIKAFEDLLKIGRGKLDGKEINIVEDRITLFIYCHLIEMQSPHHVISNLLRLNNGENYTIDPFHLAEKRRKLKSVFSKQPVAYPKDRLKIIKELDEQNLTYPMLNEIYDDRIRNAFYHSDFVITKNEFRIPSLATNNVISLTEVRLKVQKAYIFYNYLFRYVEDYRKLFYSLKDREFDLYRPYGEKLKFLFDNKSLIGFEVTRPNETNSIYRRTEKGTQAINLHFTNAGEIGFFVGDLDFLKKWYKNNMLPNQ